MRWFLLLFALLPSAASFGVEITLLADGGGTASGGCTASCGGGGAWEYQTFDGIKETTYRREKDQQLRRFVLNANSQSGASGFILKREIDLHKSPWLHFLWRVDHAGVHPAEKTRGGDDFAWRLYFVGKSGMRYHTLDFVYAQNAAVGEIWKSSYSNLFGDIYAYALAVGGADGVWRTSSVNVAEAWEALFDDGGKIGLIGLMTDGDSAGVEMRASYGLLVLSDSPIPPFAAPDFAADTAE